MVTVCLGSQNYQVWIQFFKTDDKTSKKCEKTNQHSRSQFCLQSNKSKNSLIGNQTFYPKQDLSRKCLAWKDFIPSKKIWFQKILVKKILGKKKIHKKNQPQTIFCFEKIG